MISKYIEDFRNNHKIELLREDRRSGVLRMHLYKKEMPKDVVELSIKLEEDLTLFKTICFYEKNQNVVKEIKTYFVQTYDLNFEYAGFYYRELDPLSKKFNGNYKSVLLLRFQNALIEYYCDYFLLLDDPIGFECEVINNSLGLSREYVMRSFYILLSGYNKCLPLPTVACHLIDPIESVFDKKMVTKIRQLKISSALKSLISKNGISISSSFLFEVVIDALALWSNQNSNWAKEVFEDDKGWSRLTNYPDDSDSRRVGGVFNLGCWNNGLDFPEGHRFSNNKLPIFEYRKEWITIRPDCLLDILGEKIKFSSIVENYIRDKVNLPKIGEGQWISELSLLNKVRSKTSMKVIHQWSPDWLGRQRIDIGIPDLGLAFEYNGKQHYEAVEFFGGGEGYRATKKRDKIKRELCKKNGINLIEIRYDAEEMEIDSLLASLIKSEKNSA